MPVTPDQVHVEVTFTPLSYEWTFGDGQPGSTQTYGAAEGVGLAYDATRPKLASTVGWTYQFDSRAYDRGFPVSVVATWGVSARVQGHSDFAPGNFDSGEDLASRQPSYQANYVVQQSQALGVLSAAPDLSGALATQSSGLGDGLGDGPPLPPEANTAVAADPTTLETTTADTSSAETTTAETTATTDAESSDSAAMNLDPATWAALDGGWNAGPQPGDGMSDPTTDAVTDTLDGNQRADPSTILGNDNNPNNCLFVIDPLHQCIGSGLSPQETSGNICDQSNPLHYFCGDIDAQSSSGPLGPRIHIPRIGLDLAAAEGGGSDAEPPASTGSGSGGSSAAGQYLIKSIERDEDAVHIIAEGPTTGRRRSHQIG